MFQAEDFVCKTDNCNNGTINREDCKDYPSGSEKIKVVKSHALFFWILFMTAAPKNICF